MMVVDTRDWSTRWIEPNGFVHAGDIVASRHGLGFFVTGANNDRVYSVGGPGSERAVHAAARPAPASRERHTCSEGRRAARTRSATRRTAEGPRLRGC